MNITFFYFLLEIESDPCCFQVSIASEPEKPEDEDCRGNHIVAKLNPWRSITVLDK